MQSPVLNTRLAATGTLCTVLVLTAGIVALVAPYGIAIAAMLLTCTVLAGGVGFAYASDRQMGFAIAALLAAGLPLFVILYQIGHAILVRMGIVIAGGILLGIGAALTGVTAWLWLASGRRGRLARRVP